MTKLYREYKRALRIRKNYLFLTHYGMGKSLLKEYNKDAAARAVGVFRDHDADGAGSRSEDTPRDSTEDVERRVLSALSKFRTDAQKEMEETNVDSKKES